MADEFDNDQDDIFRKRRRNDRRHPMAESMAPGGNLYGQGQTVRLDDSFRYTLDQSLARQADLIGNKFKEAIAYSKQLDNSTRPSGVVEAGIAGAGSGIAQGVGQFAMQHALEKMKRGESVFDFSAEKEALKGLKDTLADIGKVGKGMFSWVGSKFGGGRKSGGAATSEAGDLGEGLPFTEGSSTSKYYGQGELLGFNPIKASPGGKQQLDFAFDKYVTRDIGKSLKGAGKAAASEDLGELLPLEGGGGGGAGGILAGGAAVAGGAVVGYFVAKEIARMQQTAINFGGSVAGMGLDAGAGIIGAVGGGTRGPGMFSQGLGMLPSGKNMPGGGIASFLSFGTTDVVSDNIDKLKEKTGLLADSFVDLIRNGIDPVNAYIKRWIEPFVGTTAKYNPAVVERLNLAFDNLSAAAGKMFVPIIEAGRMFADDLNRLYTRISSPMQDIFGTFSKEFLSFGREFFTGVSDFMGSAISALRPVIDSLQGIGGEFGKFFRETFRMFGAGLEFMQPLINTFADTLTLAVGAIRIFTAVMTSAADTFRSMQGIAGGFGLHEPMREQRDRLGLGAHNALMRLPVYRNLFERVMQNMGDNSHIEGPMTFAAQPTRMVGIEEIGQQARMSALSQGRDVFEEQLQVQQQMLQELQNQNANNANNGAANQAEGINIMGVAQGVMAGIRGMF